MVSCFSKASVLTQEGLIGEIKWVERGMTGTMKYYDSNGVLLYILEPDKILFCKSYTLYNGIGKTVGKFDIKYNKENVILTFDLSDEMPRNIAAAFGISILFTPKQGGS